MALALEVDHLPCEGSRGKCCPATTTTTAAAGCWLTCTSPGWLAHWELCNHRGNKFDSTFPRGLVLCSTRGCVDIFRVVGYTMKRCKRCKVDNRRRALFSLICQFDFVGDAWRDAFSDKSVKWVQLKGRLWGNWNNEVTGDNPFK